VRSNHASELDGPRRHTPPGSLGRAGEHRSLAGLALSQNQAILWRYLPIRLLTIRWRVLGVMKVLPVFAIAILFGLASTCFAAEKDKGSVLTSYQLGDYSLGLDTDDPNKPDPAAPPGLTTLRQETILPFLGLKLSRPLPNNFWSFGQGSQEASTPKKPKVSKRKTVRHEAERDH
jgi:hypothetical protein